MSIPELPCRLLLNTSTSQNFFNALMLKTQQFGPSHHWDSSPYFSFLNCLFSIATCPALRVKDPSCLCAKAGLHPGQVGSLSQVPLWATLMKLKWMCKVRGQNRSKSVCFHQSNKSSKPDLSRALYFCSEYCNNEGLSSPLTSFQADQSRNVRVCVLLSACRWSYLCPTLLACVAPNSAKSPPPSRTKSSQY